MEKGDDLNKIERGCQRKVNKQAFVPNKFPKRSWQVQNLKYETKRLIMNIFSFQLILKKKYLRA